MPKTRWRLHWSNFIRLPSGMLPHLESTRSRLSLQLEAGHESHPLSFDVFLIKFSGGKKAEADRVAVRQVLDRHKFNQPSDQDFFDVQFSDGSHVEFDAKGLSGTAEFTGCSFAIRGLSDSMVAFIFDVARAEDMVLFPAVEGGLCILVDPSQKTDLPADLKFTVVECRFIPRAWRHILRRPQSLEGLSGSDNKAKLIALTTQSAEAPWARHVYSWDLALSFPAP